MHKITNRNSKSVEYASLKLGIYFVRNEDHSNEVVFVLWGYITPHPHRGGLHTCWVNSYVSGVWGPLTIS